MITGPHKTGDALEINLEEGDSPLEPSMGGTLGKTRGILALVKNVAPPLLDGELSARCLRIH